MFGDDSDNQYVFNTVAKPLVASALDGYNTVLFMYGQTSSGQYWLYAVCNSRVVLDLNIALLLNISLINYCNIR